MKASFSKTFAVAETTPSAARAAPSHAVDLFCGFGGATSGLALAGLSVALAVDFSADAVRAHRALHPGVICWERDVSEIRPSLLLGKFVWASPSCRPYSTANTTQRRGVSHPEYYPLVRLVRQAIGAAVLVIENVSGLMYSREGLEELRALERECFELGVTYQPVRAFASWYGLEQRRERVFLVIGAPSLVMLEQGETTRAGDTITTNSGKTLETISAAQGVLDPSAVLVADFRSGRRRGASHVPLLSSYASRRVIGNAVPPVMVQAVVRAVLSSFPVSQPATCASETFTAAPPPVSSFGQVAA